MNAKRCKRIRKALSDLPRAELHVKQAKVQDVLLGKEVLIPMTFRYPTDSYQRVYHDVKRYS